jgi:hypothetical protein
MKIKGAGKIDSDRIGYCVRKSTFFRSLKAKVHNRESNSAFLDLNSSSERIPF